MCKITALILLSFFVFSANKIASITIGSDTAVQEFTSQQFMQTGDRVASFAWLKYGFSLQGLNTTSTFDSLFPVSGTVALNSGNLLLNTDLIFNNNSNFYTLGNIIGNSHWIDLSASVTTVASIGSFINTNTFARQITLNMGTQVVVADWSYDSKYLAVGLANNFGNELYLFTYDGATLTQLAAISIGNHAIDVNWHPSEYKFVLGCASSPQIRIYSINPNAPNLSNVISTFALSAGGFWTTAVAYNHSGNYIAVGTTDTTQQIIVFPLNVNGTLNAGGRVSVAFGNSVTVSTEAISWNLTQEYLTVGCTNSGGTFNELRVYRIATSPSLAITLNASLLLGEVGGVDWVPTSTYLLFAGLVTTPALATYAHNGTAGTLTQEAFLTQPTLVRCVSADPSSNDVAITCDFNSTGPEMMIYSYDLTGTGVFTTVFTDQSSGSSQMDALGWSSNGNYITYGDVAGFLYIANRLSPSFLSNCFTFSNVYLSMCNDLYLQNACITFGGNCAIYGNGNTLTIMPTSTVYIDSNSRLLLEDIIVSGVADSNIQAVDDSGLLILNNVTWNLLSDYSFSLGAFSVINSFMVRGSNKIFSYLTDMASTVSLSSNLTFDFGVTFSYSPTSSANNLILFAGATSFLKLINSSLYVSSGGLLLRKGTFIVDGLSSIINTGTASTQGVIFGDGINLNNNMTINFLPAAELDVMSGFVVNKNV